tara:strand:+ start:2423 stop:2809 length:387 start_codon:yes stop_codon:yes gene_type:complete
MKPLHQITIHHKQEGKTYSFEVEEGEYILRNFESKDENGRLIGDQLPFSCRNGCCTECAVKIISGDMDQTACIGLSQELREKGYGLLCVSKAIGPLECETQTEDEVYDAQFGKYFRKLDTIAGNPFEI